MKYLILLLLLAMCHGCAPMAAMHTQQANDDWQRQRDQQAADQWQTWQIQNQQQINQQNNDWWSKK